MSPAQDLTQIVTQNPGYTSPYKLQPLDSNTSFCFLPFPARIAYHSLHIYRDLTRNKTRSSSSVGSHTSACLDSNVVSCVYRGQRSRARQSVDATLLPVNGRGTCNRFTGPNGLNCGESPLVDIRLTLRDSLWSVIGSAPGFGSRRQWPIAARGRLPTSMVEVYPLGLLAGVADCIASCGIYPPSCRLGVR